MDPSNQQDPGASAPGHGPPVDSYREDDDLGIIYHAACGDWHWRCYLCKPIERSRHLMTEGAARASFEVHVRQHHAEEAGT